MQESPGVQEYVGLREALGWGTVSSHVAERTLAATAFCVCLRDGGRLVGMVRFLGDGCLFLYLAELMVHPEYAGRGLGSELRGFAVSYIEAHAVPCASVPLLPVVGAESFYEKAGFERTPRGGFGEGMVYLHHLKSRDPLIG